MEVFVNLINLSFWEKFADFHGLLSMISLILFGAAIILYFVVKKSSNFYSWFKNILLILSINLTLLDIAGLTVYVPYRATGGPRTILKASESTAWLHTVIFEHKDFLAFAPPLIVLTIYLVTKSLGSKFNDDSNSKLRKAVLFGLIASLVFVLVVAAEAVLVTKTAPVG